MENQKIQSFMHGQGGYWIKWVGNLPAASDMDGVWERQIWSACAILLSLLKTHGKSFDEESLLTLVTETEGILKSRPLTTETISDPTNDIPLSPSNILTMKSNVIMPPPGNFSRPDLYCHKRWHRVQHIANEFWSCWRKEFFQSLQTRNKWQTGKKNF